MREVSVIPVIEQAPESASRESAWRESALLSEFGSEYRVALITCPRRPEGEQDAQILIESCARVGIELVCQVWSEPHLWPLYDALLPLCLWDHAERASSFRSWLRDREREGCRIYNQPSLIRRVMDKAYLLDLAELGVPVQPLQIRHAGAHSAGDWPPGSTVVVKPRFGAGGHGLQLGTPREWQPPLKDMVVQQFQPLVMERGELSVCCVEAQPLAAFCRRPDGIDFRVQEEWGGSTQAVELSERAIQAAHNVLQLIQPKPLYARVDFWEAEPAWQLVELELFEPRFYFELLPGLSEALARALRERLDHASQKQTMLL